MKKINILIYTLFLVLNSSFDMPSLRAIITTSNLNKVAPVIEIYTGNQVDHSIKWSPDGRYLAFHGMRYLDIENNLSPVKIWNVETNELEIDFDHNISSVEWSPNGIYFAYLMVKPNKQEISEPLFELVIRETSTWDIAYTHTVDGGLGLLSYLEWSPDGKYLAINKSQLFNIWEVNYGNNPSLSVYWNIEHENILYQPISWSPDSQYIAGYKEFIEDTNPYGYVTSVLNIAEKMTVFEMENVHENKWAPQSSLLALINFKNIKLFDTISQSYLWESDFILGTPRYISWSLDETMIIVPTSDRLDDHSLRIFNALTGEEIYLLEYHLTSVSYAEWSPDGNKIASSDQHGNIIIWGIP